MKALIKSLVRYTPYRIVRVDAKNRFDAIEETMAGLRDRGYRPTRVIDGGANVGAFARKARSYFPSAKIDMIEPQPACQEALSNLATEAGYAFHQVALVGPNHKEPKIPLRIAPGEITTGAHVVDHVGDDIAEVSATTIDELLDEELSDGLERIFLKLDLQGYELEALAGAEKTLTEIDVILTEVSFFAQAYEPPIRKLMNFLDARGFELYDIAALGSRSRDGRARQGDFVFVRRGSPLAADTSWD